MSNRPYVWQMVKEAVQNLNGRATNAEIKRYIRNKYGDINETTINCQILISCVNKQSRINWPENQKPRISNTPQYDFLYSTGRGQVELYDPDKHGKWEIGMGPNNKLKVRSTNQSVIESNTSIQEESSLDSTSDTTEDPATTDLLFPLESHLRDFIAQNINTISINGKRLRLYADDNGREGIEYPTEVGRIDILTVDEEENFVVFELKLSRGSDHTLGQLLRYMGWLKQKYGETKEVKGVIVANPIDDKLRFAASMTPNVILYEYQISFDLHPVEV